MDGGSEYYRHYARLEGVPVAARGRLSGRMPLDSLGAGWGDFSIPADEKTVRAVMDTRVLFVEMVLGLCGSCRDWVEDGGCVCAVCRCGGNAWSKHCRILLQDVIDRCADAPGQGRLDIDAWQRR